MNLERIIALIERQHGGAWWGLFKERAGGGHIFHPTGHVLSPAAYTAVVRHFEDPEKCGVLHGVAPENGAAPEVAPAPDTSDDAPAPIDGVLTAADRKRNTLQARAVESTQSQSRGRGRGR